MKRVCAWCKKELGSIGNTSNVITHSICPRCARAMLAGKKLELQTYLNTFEEPILLVDENVTAIITNNSALDLLNKSPSDIEGYLGGKVMECEYASLPGGCGKTVHCKACTIRLSVTDTFSTGKSIHNRTAYQNINTPKNTKRMHFTISTEKVGDFILLRIDDVKDVNVA